MKNLYLRASLTLTALVLSFVSFGQSLSCVNPNGNYTRPDSIEHCKGSSGGSFNQHWLDRIAAQGGIDSAGIKSSNHNRSVFVNESINRRGGFAVIQDLGTKVKPNADAVGSTFAIDTDGDCIYEREDSLLNKLQFNLVDEIILYNVSRILEDGDKTVVGGPGIPDGIFDNNLQVNQSAEWHLARFIDKAKNVVFNVVAVLPEGNINPTDSAFYKFHTSFAENTSQFSSYLEGINDAFLQKYMDLWLYAPQEVTYKSYGEDTLFLPKDNKGRISDVDKYIVDMYNLAVFQMRAERGFIELSSSQDDPCEYAVGKGCEYAFDAHFAEMEWWDDTLQANAEDDYAKLVGVMEASHAYRNSGLFTCYPELYVAQNQIDRPDDWTTWNSIPPQQRANTIDSLADRVYIYAYQRVPCDCYWGKSNINSPNGDQNDWLVKAEYFRNNSFPTDIYPVFNGKFYDSTLYNTLPPSVYGDGNYGCTSIPVDSCDYCRNRVGDAMRQLPSTADIIKLGYVENTWQEQYDFDPNNASATVPSNVHGYAWFKSSVLDGGGVINSNGDVQNHSSINNKAFLFPNPSSGEFQIIGNDALESIQVFDLTGRIVFEKNNLTSRSFNLKSSGTFIVRLKTDKEVVTQKIVVTK